MESIAASALGQVDASAQGIHVLWLGAPSFLFAPGGWVIERRPAHRRDVSSACDVLDADALMQLRSLHERRGTQGVWSWRAGLWPGDGVTKSEIITFEFDRESRFVHGQVTAAHALVIGYLRGKAVAFAGPAAGNFDLGTNAVDRVVIYAVGPSAVRVCLWGDDSAQWQHAKTIAKLQVPIREYMPQLATPQDELAEAQRRLLPGEALDPARFAEVADLWRTALRDLTTAPRQRALLMRNDASEPFDELSALDPLRMLYSDPMWRRVMGLALFDQDPTLVAGQRYDYRITGRFPALPVQSRWYGFHTIPSGTPLPAEFYLNDVLLRLAQPAVAARAPDVSELPDLLVSRRGIALAPRNGFIGWSGFGIEDASLVLDFGTPTKLIVLDLAASHALRYQAGDAWSTMSPLATLPAGSHVVLNFAVPVTQLRLFGTGFLFGFRFAAAAISGSDSMVALSTLLLQVPFTDAARPAPPLALAAANLQTVAALTTAPARRHQLGIGLTWTPALVANLPFWPPDAGPPPLDATVFQIERCVEPAGAWAPVVGKSNRVLGTRDSTVDDPLVRTGVDLMQVFPEEAPSTAAASTKHYDDVFLIGDGSGQRAKPPLGQLLGYRIRTLDVVGRPSTTWTDAAPVRLEKHEPPPLPAAPSEIPADAFLKPAPTGVSARALVRGDASLSADDLALLGTSQNAIVLEWGWHARERALDPFAKSFRVYLASPLDGIDGNLTSVTDMSGLPGVYTLAVSLQRAVAADAAKGLYLDAGTPFFIETHTAGTTIQMTVNTRVPQSGGAYRRPVAGGVRLPLRLSSSLTRPSGWAERVEVQPGAYALPITAATSYQCVLRDRLNLSDAHPRDQLWIGVTAADDQAYVPDTFPQPAPSGAMPGNESAVAFAQCQATFMERPAFDPPHALINVPSLRTPEPVDAPIRFMLDLTPYLAGIGLDASMLVKPERLNVIDLLAALRTENGHVFARVVARRHASEAESEITLPNPGDQEMLAAGLTAGDANMIDDRIAVYVAGVHPYADRLFTEASKNPVPFGPFTDTLHPGGARYVYRVRKASGGGRLSARGAIAKVVVRVPSLMPSAPPRREPRAAGDALGLLRLTVPRDPRARGVLVFAQTLAADTDIAGAQLIRLGQRPDVDIVNALRLRMPGGEVLTPSIVAFDAAQSDDLALRADVTLPAQPGHRVAAWACTVTNDDIPSTPAGPWLLRFPPA